VRLTPRAKKGKGQREDPAKTRPLSEEEKESGASEASAANGASEANGTKDATSAPAVANEQPAMQARNPNETQQLSESMVFDHYEERLRSAIEESSKVVVDYGNKHHEARGLGATVTAALVVEGMAFIANVGDSRTYLLRQGKLERVTRDHSLVERLVEAGQIDRDDVYDHPSRNLIYRSLGAGHAEVDVDIFNVQLQPGDALLLCTDGLWEMVRDPQLATILNEDQDPTTVCATLIDKANENGGEDNITALLVRCVEA
jgi:protein phosphatase